MLSCKKLRMLALVLLSVAAALQSVDGTSETPKSLSDIDTSKESVQRKIVNLHNALRAGVKPCASNMLKMEWNDEAAKSAEFSAKRCIFRHVSEDKRNISMFECGENLFMASYPATWKEAIQRWYDENKKFIYGKGPVHKDDVTGHYTQVVWAKTFLIGCAVAFCDHFYIYSCHYCPEGNDVETMNEPYNVGEPCADCKEHCLQGLCTNPCTHRDQAAYCESVKEQDLCWVPKFRKGCMATCDCKGKI